MSRENVESLEPAAQPTEGEGFSTRRPSSWRDLVSGTLILLVWLAVSVPRLHGPIDLRWDASTYYVLGTALAEGKGYRLLNEPGEIQAVQYPPLLPCVVALHQRLMGTNDFFEVGSRLRVFYFLISGLYLCAVYAFARQMLATRFACAVTVMTALSFNSFFYPSETLYAELPFALISILFLLCQRRSTQPIYAGASALLGVAAYLLRTAGIALLAAWVFESLIKRRFRQAAIRALIAAIPIVAWQAYIWHVTHGREYEQPAYAYQRAPYNYPNVTYAENSPFLDPFRPELGRTRPVDLMSRVVRNTLAIPFGLGESAWFGRVFGLNLAANNVPKNWLPTVSRALYVFLTTAGLLALFGAALMSLGQKWFLALYFALTLGLVGLTPWQSQFWRYLAPLTPLTFIFLVTALLALNRWITKGRVAARTTSAWFTVTPLAGMLLVQAVIAAVFLRNLRPVSYYKADDGERSLRLLTYEPHWHALDRAFEWVRRNAKPDAIVATSVPQLAYLRSGHKAVLPPFEPNPREAALLLDQVPVSYLILDELGRPPISDSYAAPVASQLPEKWRLAYSTPGGGTKVYERIW